MDPVIGRSRFTANNGNGKLGTTVGKRCNLGNLIDLFPICGDDLASCLVERVQCEACLAITEADQLSVDCDLLDDGVMNESCP